MKKIRFNEEMYNNPVGSFVICSFILSKEKPTLHFLKKRWVKFKKMMSNSKEEFIHPDTFVEDVRKFFKLSEENIPICMLRSDWNTLFFPYIIKENDEDSASDNGGSIIPLPLREDGIVPSTYRHYNEMRVIEW